MSNQPPYNPYYDQQQPPPAGWNTAPPGSAPPYGQPAPGPYGQPAYGPPPYNQGFQGGGPPAFPPPVHGFAGHQNMGAGGVEHHDIEANLIKTSTLGFDNKSIRAGFVRKVCFFFKKKLSLQKLFFKLIFFCIVFFRFLCC